MSLGAPTEEQLLAIHEALIEGCQSELYLACDPGRADEGAALIALLHGTPEAQVAFGSRAEVARELSILGEEEGPAAIDLARAGVDLLARPPVAAGRLLCVVVALGRARIHDLPWPRAAPPTVMA